MDLDEPLLLSAAGLRRRRGPEDAQNRFKKAEKSFAGLTRRSRAAHSRDLAGLASVGLYSHFKE